MIAVSSLMPREIARAFRRGFTELAKANTLPDDPETLLERIAPSEAVLVNHALERWPTSLSGIPAYLRKPLLMAECDALYRAGAIVRFTRGAGRAHQRFTLPCPVRLAAWFQQKPVRAQVPAWYRHAVDNAQSRGALVSGREVRHVRQS